MIIQRMPNNPHSFRVGDREWPLVQKTSLHQIEAAVLEQVGEILQPGEAGEFEIIVRRKIQEVAA